MPQYKVEALRTIRAIQAQHERAGHDAKAEQMRRIGDQVEKMAEELAALKEAVRPVVRVWTDLNAVFVSMDMPMPAGVSVDAIKIERLADITATQLDELARLCGEE